MMTLTKPWTDGNDVGGLFMVGDPIGNPVALPERLSEFDFFAGHDGVVFGEHARARAALARCKFDQAPGEHGEGAEFNTRGAYAPQKLFNCRWEAGGFRPFLVFASVAQQAALSGTSIQAAGFTGGI
jgi:hypothetical protein